MAPEVDEAMNSTHKHLSLPPLLTLLPHVYWFVPETKVETSSDYILKYELAHS